jgi:hypothetical protein
MPNKLFNMTMNDGSRHFYARPMDVSWDDLLDSLEKLKDMEITAIVTDDVVETWVDFTYRNYEFSINNQNDDYWFFAETRGCPDDVLLEVIRQAETVESE